MLQHNEKINVSNPIVYIFLTLIISSIFYVLYEDYKELTIFIAGFFFAVLLYRYYLNFVISMVLIFFIGLWINSMYYYIPHNINDTVRIKSVNSYGILGLYKEKTVNLKFKKHMVMKEGEKYKIKGEGSVNDDFKYGISGTIEVQCCKKEKEDCIAKLAQIKRTAYKKLEENLGSRKSGLISSMSFGYKEYLDKEDKDIMQNWGIIHTISVSGLHIMLVYGIVQRMAGKGGGLIITFIYVLLTGGAYSSLRAFLMLVSIIGAEIVQRNNNSLSSISLAGIIILIKDPICIFQMSFQLSFLATIGIILFKDFFHNKLYKLNPKIREILSISLSAQVLTAPLIMISYNEFTLNFILGNMVLVPIINILVILGNLSILVMKVEMIFDLLCYGIFNVINFLDFTMNLCSNFNMAALYTNEYVVTIYCIMFVSSYFIKKNFKKFAYVPAITLAIILVQIYSPVLTLKYYDEGAVLISYKGNRILYCEKNCKEVKALKERTYASKVYEGSNKIRIGKDLIMENREEKLILNNKNQDYGIISFEKNNINTLYVFNKEKPVVVESMI